MHDNKKYSGLLMPVASLPSDYGIGDFGKYSYEFVDILKDMEFKIWQLLPLNPLGFGNSPYQPYSSKAIDELYLDLDEFYELGLIDKPDNFNEEKTNIEYDAIREYKRQYIDIAFEKYEAEDEYLEFRKQAWVIKYAKFIELKQKNNMILWTDWPLEDREFLNNHEDIEISIVMERVIFGQYFLFRQWLKLKEYANSKGIIIMGDIPIYVGLDSEDVWSNRKQFLLDDDGRPVFIAGVPPDSFSATGQRWGNPIYDWDLMKEEGFKFWLERLNFTSKLFDTVRIDHFRAFDTYWKIPASCETAMDGEWIEAPGYEFFDTLYETYPDINIVAEDLGDLRPEVLVLKDHYGLKGMRIFEESIFYEGIELENPNTIIYTGTHDNRTLRAWYKDLSQDRVNVLDEIMRKYNIKNRNENLNIIEYMFNSNAQVAVIPMVDLINLDDNSRINTPGTVGSPNWEWKLDSFDIVKKYIEDIKTIINKTDR